MISKNQAEDRRSGSGQSTNMRPFGHHPEDEEPELLGDGLVPIKTRIREIAALLLVDRLRNRYGLTTTRPTLHMMQASRLPSSDNEKVGKGDLVRIQPADIAASRVSNESDEVGEAGEQPETAEA